MDQNMGAVDRAVRAFLVAPAAFVLALVVGAGTIGGIVLLVVAGIMLLTAVVGFCPTYTVIGISTQPRPHRVAHHHWGRHA